MESKNAVILNHQEILIRLRRMANEIAEQHCDIDNLYLVGLNERGYFLASEIGTELKDILPAANIETGQVSVVNNKALFASATHYNGKTVIVVDDVINSGRTLMVVLSELFAMGAAHIQTVFLAKREHRNFPVKADYVGISIATTLQEHVLFDNADEANLRVYLQ